MWKLTLGYYGIAYSYIGYEVQAQNVHNKSRKDPKFIVGSTKMCPGISRHILDGQMGSQGKKKQAVLLLCCWQ